MIAKRSCFPACPPDRVLTVNKCTLPGKVSLPPVTNTEVNCPSEYICYDEKNSKNLYIREEILKQWIIEARKMNTSVPSEKSNNCNINK